MKAIILRISFFEAHFRSHLTRGFRLSYPIPLPTSVAGMFGCLLGIKRKEILDKFKDFYFGAKLLNLPVEVFENATMIQIGKKFDNWPPLVAPLHILFDPEYLIALGGSEDEVNKIYENLKTGDYEFLPYGGQNDFFVKDIALQGIDDVKESYIIENYAPKNLIEKIEIIDKNSFLSLIPVQHKISDDSFFYFGYKVKFKLKEKIKTVEGVGLYKLEDFYYL